MRASPRFPTFRALQHRDFRLVWAGFAISSVGTWMQIVAQSLLVLDLTHGSPAALGAVSLVQVYAWVAVCYIVLLGPEFKHTGDICVLHDLRKGLVE